MSVRDVSQEELDRLLATGSRSDLDKAVKMLIAKKGSIEAQLRMAKTDMVVYRQQLIDAGYHPQQAKMEAEAFAQPDWRNRAVGALKWTDSQISRVRSRISALSGVPKTLTAEVLPVATAAEAADKIREMAASGAIDYFHAAIPFPDGVLLIYRKGDPS